MIPTLPIPRHATAQVIEALADTRSVSVEGPRQAGKSTLCEGIATEQGMRVVTLDDPTARRVANDDPAGFIAGLGERAFIDELQAPDLALALRRRSIEISAQGGSWSADPPTCCSRPRWAIRSPGGWNVFRFVHSHNLRSNDGPCPGGSTGSGTGTARQTSKPRPSDGRRMRKGSRPAASRRSC